MIAMQQGVNVVIHISLFIAKNLFKEVLLRCIFFLTGVLNRDITTVIELGCVAQRESITFTR